MSSPKPPEPPPPPIREDPAATADADNVRRRRVASSGIASTFLLGSSGQPGTVGKVGLTGTNV